MPGRAPVTVDRIQAIDIRSKRIIHQCTNRYPNRAIESREAQVNDEQQKDLSFLYPVGGYELVRLLYPIRGASIPAGIPTSFV